MKAHLLIAALLTTLAHAQPYPLAPSVSKLVVEAVRDRKVNAPYYAESPTASVIPTVRDLARFAKLPVLDRLAATPATRPDTAPAGPVSLRMLPRPMPSNPRTLLLATQAKSLPSWTTLAVDPFMLKVEFLWEKPHCQWLNSLLKQINAAKAAGDTATYKLLTAQYSAWADKYLRRDEPPNLDNMRGR
jgi:hypothetical protein